jgi:hypothetical protein
VETSATRATKIERHASWLALAVAFSWAIVDLAKDLIDYPATRYTMLAPLLLVLAVRARASEQAPRHRDGAIGIALGIAAQTLGILTQSWSIARFGLPVACVGLARFVGWPPVAVVALTFFAIPPPDVIAMLPSPELETGVARVAGAILHGVGFPIESRGFSLVAPAGRLELGPAECGITLAFVAAALGWYSAVRTGGGVARALRRAVLAALLALPIQGLVVLASGAALAGGWKDAGRLLLLHGGWIGLSAAVLAWLHRPSARVTSAGVPVTAR